MIPPVSRSVLVELACAAVLITGVKPDDIGTNAAVIAEAPLKDVHPAPRACSFPPQH
jgi:hypothetical protein